MNHENQERIRPLDQLSDMKVADGDPDVRGWDVVGADGSRIGEVDNLLVDTTAMKVRYLSVELDKDVRGADGDRNILIPVGHARLDEKDDRVLVNSMRADQVRSVPRYTGRLDRDYENSLNTHFSGGRTTQGNTSEDYYADSRFDDNDFFGSRRSGGTDDRDRHDRITRSEEELDIRRERQQAGEVRVNKHVETEHVRQEVPVRHEEVEIERRPVSGSDAMNTSARMQDDEIRVPVMEEHVDVTKRSVPKEEIVVRKRQVEETETVEADLRRERVDIDESGNVHDRDRTDRR
jgi:uncharacterized protein (TIGR02271 family)